MQNNLFGSQFESQITFSEQNLRFGEGGLRLQGIRKKSTDKFPLISIITVVYNGKRNIEETILSVLGQDYPNLEYIIVDGGSNDGTLEVLKKYSDRIDYWVSEKDKGISDAFNKGVILSSGEYINFQGDGDGFYDRDSISKLFKGVSNNCMLLAGRISRTDLNGKEIFVSPRLTWFRKSSLLFSMSLPHQGLFTKIDFFKKYGLFNPDFKYAMDYEHLLRAYENFPKVVTKNVVVAKWRADGIGEGRILEIFREYDKIKRYNKVAPNLILDLINIWTHLKYKIKKIFQR